MKKIIKQHILFAMLKWCEFNLIKSGKFIMLFLIMVCGISCVKDEFKIDEYKQKVVVDGWIETGRPATVILTYSIPYFAESNLDTGNIYDYVNSRAKVTVSDGEEEEVLILRPDKYYSYLVYQGSFLRGEPGKSYTLNISDRGNQYSAVTSIPEQPQIDTVWFEKEESTDTTGTIWVTLTDNKNTEDYYRFSYRTDLNTLDYKPTLFANIEDVYINGETVDIALYKQSENLLNTTNEVLFKTGAPIFIKISNMDKISFEFWSTMQLEVLNTYNPFAESKSRVKSNIQGGALGVWSGFASRTYAILPE